MTMSQYFVYKRPIAWTLLISTMAGGVRGLPLDAAAPGPSDPDPQRRGPDGLSRGERRSRSSRKSAARSRRRWRRTRPSSTSARSAGRGSRSVFVDLYDTTRNAEAVWQDLDNKLAAMTDLPRSATAPAQAEARQGLRRHGRRDAHAVQPAGQRLRGRAPGRGDRREDPRGPRRAARVPPRPPVQRGPGPSLDGSTRAFSSGSAGPASNTSTGLGLIEDGQIVALLGARSLDFRLADGRDPAAMRDEIRRWESDNVAQRHGPSRRLAGGDRQRARRAGRRAETPAARTSPAASPDTATRSCAGSPTWSGTGSANRPRWARSS